MKKYDMISSIVSLFISLFFLRYSLSMPMGQLGTPGPAFMPFGVALILAMLSVVLCVEAFLRKKDETVMFFSGQKRWEKVMMTIVFLLIYSFAIELVGFITCTLILMFLLFWYIGGISWRFAVVGTFLVTFSVHFIFKTILKVQLPRGIF